MKPNKILSFEKELRRRLGFLRWMPTYSKMDAVSDLIAGVTLGLTIVPQSIAYASLARLPAEIGLYSAFAGGFLYVLFGTIKQVSIGPTSIMSLLTLQYLSNVPEEYALQYLFLLTFLCGVVELLMGLLRLGFLTEVISTPVISGFTSASAIIIIVSQIKHILGVEYKSDSFNEDLVKAVTNIPNLKKEDTILGISCIVLLLCLRRLKDCRFKIKTLKRIFWFISIGRNVIIVLLCCLLTVVSIKLYGREFFKLTNYVRAGLPTVHAPPFEMQQGNTTVTFFGMVKQLKGGFIIIPIVAVLINVSIAKAFATGGTVDVTQEMISLAFCNILASFLSSMPICGAFTRSAVSNASGVRTPFSNFYSVIITILALTFITPYFHYIPKATLAAVLISAVVFIIDVQIIVPLWKACKRDLCILISTIFVCLYFGVEIGLAIGVCVNLLFLLYLWARPNISCEKRKNEYGEYIVLTPQLGFYFLGSEFLYTYLSKVANKNIDKLPVAVNCCYFKGIDYSAVKALSMISLDFKMKGQKLVFYNVNEFIIKICEDSQYKNIQMCTYRQNINEFLFNEVIDFRRSVTIPIMDTELQEIKTPIDMNKEKSATKHGNRILLYENEIKDLISTDISE